MITNVQSFDELFNSFGNKIEQSKGSFKQLYDRIKAINPKRILEIGFRYGGTAKMWQHMLPPQGLVVSVDVGSAVASDRVDLSGQPEIKLVLGNSHDVEIIAKVKQYALFDAIFIDGDHSYEGVKADYENYVPMVRSGGIVAFHDHGHGPILKFWNELQVPGKIVLQDSLTIGLFQKV